MKIILLAGNMPHHIALAEKISKQHQLAGVVLESRQSPFSFSKKIAAVIDKLFFGSISTSWKNLMFHYRRNFSLPNTDILNVTNINDGRTIVFISQHQPDLIVVSGTNIIRKEILALKPRYGIINLHTGISPYIRGGPNCTNWCISNNEFHKIGSTIMWIDAGIDSGNIIASEATPLTGRESLNEIHLKVMEHAHDLYLRSMKKMEADISQVKSVTQRSIGEGALYLTRMWGFAQKKKLLRNIKKYKGRDLANSDQPEKIITIDL
jgi:methionyl-tRNA formyltransferase